MKSNREIRREARALLKTRWLWRLTTVALVLNLIAQLASGLIIGAFKELDVHTWSDFALAKIQAMQAGLDYAVPSVRVAWQMTGASLFQTFVVYLFGAIFAFGFAGAVVKAVRNDEKGWLADAFGGFRQPWGVTWLMVLVNIKVALWSLLLVVPGIVAAYRYRQAWYLKAEHPDWGASKCIDESARMMAGNKGKAFLLDLSYLGWLLLLSVAVAISAVVGGGSVPMALLAMVLQCFSIFLMLFVLCYFFVGRGVFYRELRDTCSR